MISINCNSVVNNGNVQDVLDCTYECTIRWYIGLSISKCSALHPGPKNPETPFIINNALAVVNEIRDLGIYIDNKLVFDGHTGYITG